jgi:hypothetical protein
MKLEPLRCLPNTRNSRAEEENRSNCGNSIETVFLCTVRSTDTTFSISVPYKLFHPKFGSILLLHNRYILIYAAVDLVGGKTR